MRSTIRMLGPMFIALVAVVILGKMMDPVSHSPPSADFVTATVTSSPDVYPNSSNEYTCLSGAVARTDPSSGRTIHADIAGSPDVIALSMRATTSASPTISPITHATVIAATTATRPQYFETQEGGTHRRGICYT